MTAVRYRLWQFWGLLTKRIAPDQLAQVRGWLTPELFAVFCQLNPSEQHHAYKVRCLLMAQGHTDSDLLIAALLHDVGKSQMPLAIWEKIAIVLGNRFAAQTVRGWGNRLGTPAWWQRPFVNYYQHPAWGGQMVAAGGASPLVIELVRRHQDKITVSDPLYDLLSALQSADNSN
jgi:hypothetical protein